MVAYNFQPEFADKILSGVKYSTIRPNGKRRHAQRGDWVQLYTGMRTKACTLLDTVQCVACLPIEVHADRIVINGHQLPADMLGDFARQEGFETIGNLTAWFDHRYGLPALDMSIIYWNRGHGKNAAQGAESGGP